MQRSGFVSLFDHTFLATTYVALKTMRIIHIQVQIHEFHCALIIHMILAHILGLNAASHATYGNETSVQTKL